GGQRLPVDVPRPERATLGGSLAVNVSGPRRLGLGTFRDYVIGISTVNDEGQETKAGGRVVKNVAGYDLCKLHIGALGTLGIITQVTLKVRPRPETQALLLLGCESAALGSLLEPLHASRTRPVCVDLLNTRAARLLHAHAGSGIVRGHVLGDLTAERAAAMLDPLTALATAAQGNLVLPRCPGDWKRTLPVWGQPRGDVWLMRQVKEKLDPRRLFNP